MLLITIWVGWHLDNSLSLVNINLFINLTAMAQSDPKVRWFPHSYVQATVSHTIERLRIRLFPLLFQKTEKQPEDMIGKRARKPALAHRIPAF